MKSKPHHSRIYHSFEEFVADSFTEAGKTNPQTISRARQRWNHHVEKNGNVPMIVQCSVCSGQEHKHDVRTGAFKPARPGRVERDESHGKQTDE